MKTPFRIILLSALSMIATKSIAQDIYKNGWIDFNKNNTMDIYEDPSKPVEQRVQNLLSLMTFEEKYQQIRSLTDVNVKQWDPVKQPLGLMGHISNRIVAAEAVDVINYTQKKQISQTRLGIPLIIFEEALHGLKTEKATAFPQAICMGSTWNTPLMAKVSEAIAMETKSRGVRQVLSPVVDLARDPRWGRAQETYGEDPYLVSQMAVAFCKSFEDMGVITTPKHFVANSGEGGRDSWAQYYTDRYLEELYFKPYEACIKKAGSRSIMPSYNTLNGVPCVADRWLLTTKAREQWGFKGFYGSDFNAVMGMRDLHHISASDEEIAVMAINAGMDVEWPRAIFYDEPARSAIKKGTIDKQKIEASAERILRVKFETGLFDHPFGDKQLAVAQNESPEHVALALEAAREGIVLLKNENHTLPFDANKIKTILVVGDKAKTQDIGNYSGTGMQLVSFLDGLKNQYPGIKVLFHPGVESSMTKFSPLIGKLFTNGQTTGFKAEIYDNRDFAGQPKITNNYNKLFIRSFGGEYGAPKPGMAWNNTAMRITSRFTPPKSVTAQFAIEGTGKIALKINGVEVLNNGGTKGKKDGFFDDAVGQIGLLSDIGNPMYITSYQLEKGKTYDLEITYIHPDNKQIQLSLNWDQRISADDDIRDITTLAQKADAVVAFPDGVVEGEFIDRSSVMYAPEEEALINALAATQKPYAVVMVNGAAMATANWEPNVPAIIENWYSGQQGGNALTEILFGKTNPSGKTTVTFPQIDGQLPLTYDYRPVGRRTGFQDPLHGKPAFAFGHGLSYTTFKYSQLVCSATQVKNGESLKVTYTISNNGSLAGYETSQVYIHVKHARFVRPLKELKGFTKTWLNPGESKTVTITLSPEELSTYDKDMIFAMEPGDVDLYVGSSSEDIRLTGGFKIVQ